MVVVPGCRVLQSGDQRNERDQSEKRLEKTTHCRSGLRGVEECEVERNRQLCSPRLTSPQFIYNVQAGNVAGCLFESPLTPLPVCLSCPSLRDRTCLWSDRGEYCILCVPCQVLILVWCCCALYTMSMECVDVVLLPAS